MNELQEKQLSILKEFVRVCESHHLTYFLCGGSMLGAIRHHGFIPWDDDIDVMMPRKDYDEYVKLQSEYEGTPYFIQTYKTDPHYPYSFAKLRDSSTTYIEDFFKNHQFNHGVWIDIFPLDGASKVMKPAKKCKNRIMRVWLNYYLCYLPALFRKVRKQTFFKDILLNIVAFFFWWGNIAHYRNKHMDNICRKLPFDSSPMVANHFGFNMDKEAMDASIFKEAIQVPFEDMRVNVPKRYDEYLRNIYGDYMKLPPIEKQAGHHHNKGFDLNKGYKEYMKEHKI